MEKKEITQPISGMKMGKHPSNLKNQEYSLLVNGLIESITGDFMTISNENSNILCSKLKGYKLIGSYPVPSLNLTFVALVGENTPSGTISEIGFIDDSYPTYKQDKEVDCPECNKTTKEPIPLELIEQRESCNYYTVVNASCLNFSIDHPVKMWVKVDDCNVRIYITDGINPLRYIDYPDFQKQEIINCPKVTNDELDCNRIKIFPDSCYPIIEYMDVVSGGQNTAGVYQFAIAYADAYGNNLTNYYYIPNPIPLFDQSKTITTNTDYPVYKSIKINISNINSDFDWFNLVVLKTINNTTSPYLVNTFSNTGDSLQYVYSGIDKNLIKDVSLDTLFVPKATYLNAENLTESNGILIFQDLKEPRKLNLQPVFNELTVEWATREFDEGAYANPIIAANSKGYLRDEVVSVAIELFRNTTSGIKTARFHVPGREAISSDLEDVTFLPNGNPNPDVFNTDVCDTTPSGNPRWTVYNTASVTGNLCSEEPPSGNSTSNTRQISIDCYPRYAFGYSTENDGWREHIWNTPCEPDIITAEPFDNQFCNRQDDRNPCLMEVLERLTNPTVITTTTTYELELDINGDPVEYNCASLPAPRYRWTQHCHYLIEYEVEDACQCEYTTTSKYDCYSDYFYYDPNDGLYYSTPSGTIEVEPSDYYDCNDCEDNVKLAYPNYCAITKNPAIPATELVQIGGTRIVNIYDTSPLVPAVPSPPSGVANPTNTTCLFALEADSYNCSDDANRLLVKLNDDGTGTELLYYSFIPTSDAYAITINSVYNQTTGNNFTIKVYTTSDGFCSGISATPFYDVTQSTTYFLIENLTGGQTYYFTVQGDSNVNAGVDDFYYLCTESPIPISQTTLQLRDVYNIHCIFDVTYCLEFDPCEGLPYKYGKMAYWESTERYPCNTELWGDLADKPIRHHKFPDCLISPHFINPNNSLTFQNKFNSKVKIYPIGLKIDVNQIKALIMKAYLQGLITDEERQSICGYRILRGDRRGNESIIAKGQLYDVWKYKDNIYKTNEDTLYPNYVFNSLQDDIFNLTKKLENIVSPTIPIEHPFKSSEYRNDKYVFLGANTLFNNPGLGTEIKLELEHNGIAESKYSEAINHAKYQYSGIGAVQTAFTFATVEALFETIAAINSGGWVSAAILSSIASMMWGTRVPENFYDWLDIIKKLAPFKNFAWYSTAIGNYSDVVNPNFTNIKQGNIRRSLNSAQYLQQGFPTVQDGATRRKMNNFRRESSVYLNLRNISGGDNSSTLTDQRDYFDKTVTPDTSRWYPGDNLNPNCLDFGNNYNIISSYYASLKNYLPSQYGTIGSIEYIDTGYNGVIDWNNSQDTSCDVIYGGDTFINRFGVRRQFSYYIQDRIAYPPNSDVQYGELGNVGYPRFFFNYPKSATVTDESAFIDISQLYGDVAINNFFRRDYNFNCEEDTGDFWLTKAGRGALHVARGIVAANLISGAGVAATVDQVKKTFDYDNPRVYIGGKFFLYSFGVNSFITESNYNLDYRYGTDFRQGNFYPNISDLVTWTQPDSTYNLINFDNTYNYNLDYSKQNRENFGYTLPPNFSQEKEDCKAEHSNRVIYSLQDNDNNDRFDGNLVFQPNSFHDFAKSAGKLSIVKGIDNNKVIVVQENQASIFNAFSTLQADVKAVAVGSGSLFNNNLQQFIKTDLGYGGSQTDACVTTEFGTYWVDNKRGQIFQYSNNIADITLGENQWWFKEFLPFKILEDFPPVDINNNYKYFGMAIAYDSRLKRILFTKRDAKLLPEYKNSVTFDGTNFIHDGNIILPTNPKYFCNQSWTIGYSPIFKNFISFYSYTPNYYISQNSYFQSGINYPTNIEQEGLWNHLLNSQSWTCFYGNKYNFLLEYSTENTITSNILNNTQWRTDYKRYVNQYDNYLVDKTYDKLTVYNQWQSTGNLDLIKKIKNNMSQFAKYSGGRIPTSALVENDENMWSVSDIYDNALHNNQSLMTYNCLPYTEVNPDAIKFTNKFPKQYLRNNYFVIRLEDTTTSNYKISHFFNINTTTKSD